ncbi:gfo/Idh/MocA family oxidoreductase [Paenibacillus sp. 5J-6]|uniref:Gfo/Idh/MocA family oxidoreductase n=1 Tax=Paenibacillus silvestris TaxID=2606219 RepID=A0A6L8V8Y1_9BACL|nr:Gfo/Idh/MocA family oxidoreductase [Paenibacillus silvestris]MZQ86096.1 gfo/Idh/MocA family oxidoreductase [Paenibacillus silvestris]
MEGHGRFTHIGKTYGLGVIGLGEGKGLIKGLHGHPELKVIAICDVNETLVRKVQTDYEILYGYGDVLQMFSREDIDIVAIYTPDQLHLAHIEACFRAGKHVICTKPLVNSLAEARQVMQLTAAYPHTKLMVGQSSRFFGPMQEQRKAFEAGRLGPISFMETHYVHDMRWFYGNRPWAMEGGFDLLFACYSHPIDLIKWYMGEVEEVSAYASRSLIAEQADFQGNDTFIINLKFTSGRIGRVLGLYGLEQPHQCRPWIEVAAYGTLGTFIAKYPQLEAVVKYKGEHEHVASYFEDTYHYFQFEGVNHHAGEFVNYTEHFARCLTEGTSAQPDAADGFTTIATLEAIRASIQRGVPVRVERV